MERYVIINADDFGMCHAHNGATMELLEKGCVTSATIMAPCPWAGEAARFAAARPHLGVGVHLTTTCEWQDYRWGPVTGRAAPSLMDGDGYMWRTGEEFAVHADLGELEKELTAQIERLMGMGLTPSHLDSHMGTMYGLATGRFELLYMAVELAGRYHLPFRCPRHISMAMMENRMLGIPGEREQLEALLSPVVKRAEEMGVAMADQLLPGDWNGPQKDSYENYREYIYELYRSMEPGVTETYIHPAREGEEIQGITGLWQRRVWEYRLYSDPATMRHIRGLGIVPISYRELARLRGMEG